VVISNPPYLTEAEASALPSEPRAALFGGADGLDFYRKITAEAADWLNPGGLLIFETGWDQRKSVMALMEENGFANVQSEKDYGGNDRVVWAFRQTIGE
jgi:release factor glutamine methyltransferase